MENKKQTFLIVEDDYQIRNYLCFALKEEGFSYFTAHNAQSGLSILVTEKIDIMLLDLGLPDFDGMQVIKKVREWSEIPIIVVSARDQDKEKAEALDNGADDFLTKPFSKTELMARIRVAIRHLNKSNKNTVKEEMSVGELKINFSTRQVFLKDELVHITPLEYNLLSLLFKHIGKVLTTHFIIKEIYGINYGPDTQALRSLMAGLRRKIEQYPAKPRYILTEVGVGYRLVSE